MTVLELINSSRRLIGKSRPGRGVSATHSETVDALWILNSMLESWSIERLVVYYVPRSTYTLTADQQSYTIGSGGDFDAARPVRITRAGLVLANQSETVELPMGMTDVDGWARITLKETESTIPQILYNDNNYPLSTINLWPVPTVAHTLVLYPWQALSGFSAATETVQMPPGYADAVRYNLAVMLAPEWGVMPRPDVVQMAREFKARIKALNQPSLEMACDPALLPERSGLLNYDQRSGDGVFADSFSEAFI